MWAHDRYNLLNNHKQTLQYMALNLHLLTSRVHILWVSICVKCDIIPFIISVMIFIILMSEQYKPNIYNIEGSRWLHFSPDTKRNLVSQKLHISVWNVYRKASLVLSHTLHSFCHLVVFHLCLSSCVTLLLLTALSQVVEPGVSHFLYCYNPKTLKRFLLVKSDKEIQEFNML